MYAVWTYLIPGRQRQYVGDAYKTYGEAEYVCGKETLFDSGGERTIVCTRAK
jgi:hypothetical protein